MGFINIIMLIIVFCFEGFRTACRICVSWLQRHYGQCSELLACMKEFASLVMAPCVETCRQRHTGQTIHVQIELTVAVLSLA